MGSSKIPASVVLMTVLVVAATRGAVGQTIPSCANQLIPCANYMKATNPPATCCDPLRTAVTTDLRCLCDLYKAPGLLQYYNITVNDALQLASRCKIPGDLSSCVKAGVAPGPGSSTASLPPPVTPGKDNSGADTISWSAMSSILLFWASTMFY